MINLAGTTVDTGLFAGGPDPLFRPLPPAPDPTPPLLFPEDHHGPPPRAGVATSGAVGSQARIYPTIACISASVIRSPQVGIAVPGTPRVMICCKAASLVSAR